MTPSGHLARVVRNRLGSGVCEESVAHANGDLFVVHRERLLELVGFLQRDPDTDLVLLVDIAGIDLGERADDDTSGPPRFEVRYHLRSPRLGYRAHLTVRVDEHDPTVPTLTSLYPAAEVLERELHEMFGIYPDGHPLLRPLLLYTGFVGHPLRKDYRATKQQPLVPLRDDDIAPIVIEADATGGAP